MNESEIESALSASGDCSECGGSGEVFSDSRQKNMPCQSCRGTGTDPRAVLRAVQAVGHLLMDRLPERDLQDSEG
jgi:DnaJ-class molecular chaperone